MVKKFVSSGSSSLPMEIMRGRGVGSGHRIPAIHNGDTHQIPVPGSGFSPSLSHRPIVATEGI